MTVINNLPLEIIAFILDNTPDLFTLLYAIQSSRIFSTEFALRPDKITISCFEREWGCPCPLLDKAQSQAEDERHQQPRQNRRRRRQSQSQSPSQRTPIPATKITHSTCGRLLLELLALARSADITPKVLGHILRTIFPHFQNRSLEESLFPIAVAIARSYIRRKNPRAALDLVQAIYGCQGVFRWRAPAPAPDGMARHGDVTDADGGRRSIWAATRDRRRIAFYPVARLILEIKDELGIDGGRPVTQAFRGQVWGLRMQFRNSPVLLIGGGGQVALFPWEGMGVGIPACVRAVVKVTKWGIPSPRETLLDATVRAYGVTHRVALWRFEGEGEKDMLYKGSGAHFSSHSPAQHLVQTINVYRRLATNIHGIPPRNNRPRRAGARLEKARAGEEEKKKETRRLIVTGQRGPHELNASEVLAAAGDYTAERAVVDILLQDGQLMWNGYLCLREVLRTFHLGTVSRLLQRVEGGWEMTGRLLEAATRNEHSGAGIVRVLFEQRGLEFEVAEEWAVDLVVRVAANNEGCGRGIMEVLFERQEARDRGVYEALCAAGEDGMIEARDGRR
ncbi:hypothetical protein BJY00DRAFT_319961 [Aspergillus carlsbadensis]|nr:hypothetical protein BJY00DRAFT_319961 [Aspergillus carlsbadensis]